MTPLAHDFAHIAPEGGISSCGLEIRWTSVVFPAPDRCPRCAAISRRRIADINHNHRKQFA